MIHKHWELEPDELIPINGICGNRYENNSLCCEVLSYISYIRVGFFILKGLTVT